MMCDGPSGKLAETFPVRLEDTPCFLDFPGEYNECNYTEGIFVGYRWYDKRRIPVNFPFGYGLSYTSFSYDRIERDGDKIKVTVKNIGDREGKETAQLYVGYTSPSEVKRPVRELRAYEKITLGAGEEKTVEFKIDERWFSYFCTENGKWSTSEGEYTVYVGPSSACIPLMLRLTVEGKDEPELLIDMTTTVGDIATRKCFELARAFYFDSMFPMREFADEVAIHGYTMENKYIYANRYYVPRQYVDRRNWPEAKIYEIIERANEILKTNTVNSKLDKLKR